jgi:Cu-Zn family superoxide dismutase
MRLVHGGLLAFALMFSGGATGCGSSAPTTSVTLLSATGQMLATATFTQSGDSVLAEVNVTGATAGKHGVHIHDVGKCDPPDFMTAGGHWNPTAQMHGDPTAAMHHVGDFGNIDVGADGTGTLKLTTALSLHVGDPTYVPGHAMILHQNPDDLTTQPTGNSGGRQACGVIPAPAGN